MKEITLKASIENIEEAIKFVEQSLEEIDCPLKIITQINIAIDEIFGNIAYYAYKENGGMVKVQLEIFESPSRVELTFIDSGTPYNPLLKKDPDVSLDAEHRKIGGLGIYMVKKSMDDISYEYKNQQNILKIRKNITRNP